jgi:hypothetical protein
MIVLENHVFDVHGGLLIEGVFQDISIRLLLWDGFLMGVALGVTGLVGLLGV